MTSFNNRPSKGTYLVKSRQKRGKLIKVWPLISNSLHRTCPKKSCILSRAERLRGIVFQILGLQLRPKL